MKVSIIMPTYNDDKHIGLSIQSVLDQTYKNWELLIMDDGSTDRTEQKVNEFNDLRIKYFYQENRGQLVALNNLCPYISGDIVMMLHSDDKLYSNDTLEKNLKYFNNQNIDGLYGDLHQFFDSGKADKVSKAPQKMGISAVKKLFVLLGSNIIFDHFFVTRKSFENNVKYNYFKHYMPYWLNFNEDNVSSLNLLYTPIPWYHYRVYDQNYTNSVIGNFEVYFTRFRSIFFLSDYFVVPFPLIQKEILRRLQYLTPVCSKKSSKKKIADYYKANIRSMKARTENAYVDYFEKLVTYYNNKSNKTIVLKSEIEISYVPSEARKFYHDLINNTLSPVTSEIIDNFSFGFSTILVKNHDEKQKLDELLNFMCVKVETIIRQE